MSVLELLGRIEKMLKDLGVNEYQLLFSNVGHAGIRTRIRLKVNIPDIPSQGIKATTFETERWVSSRALEFSPAELHFHLEALIDSLKQLWHNVPRSNND